MVFKKMPRPPSLEVSIKVSVKAEDLSPTEKLSLVHDVMRNLTSRLEENYLGKDSEVITDFEILDFKTSVFLASYKVRSDFAISWLAHQRRDATPTLSEKDKGPQGDLPAS